MPTRQDDITSPNHQTETWNTCPECGKSWQTIPSIPGVIHRTKQCDSCRRNEALSQPEDLDE